MEVSFLFLLPAGGATPSGCMSGDLQIVPLWSHLIALLCLGSKGSSLGHYQFTDAKILSRQKHIHERIGSKPFPCLTIRLQKPLLGSANSPSSAQPLWSWSEPGALTPAGNPRPGSPDSASLEWPDVSTEEMDSR